MKQLFIIAGTAAAFAMSVPTKAVAQDASDALRFSFLQPQGTARSIGFGNALGSIGGDFTSLSINPAGIGIYRKSEFMITPSIMFNNVDSRYSTNGTTFGNRESDAGAHFSISNIGAVFTTAAKGRNYDQRDWKSFSFGIGMNRMADFTRNYTYSGTNNTSSGSWVFEADANQYPNDVERGSSPGYLGYQSYLLDTGTLGGQPGYISVINPAVNPVKQTTSVRERGGMSEFVLSWGGNYREKLLIGGTIGIPYLRYIREKTYQEQDLSGISNNSFDSYTYTEDLRTNGLGINAKLGLIYKPSDYFRVGAAVHTPTWMRLSDRVDYGVAANTEEYAGVRSATAATDYDYNLSTPWKGIASATALFGPYGFITLDYEYVDYSTSRFSFDKGDRDYERAVNNEIQNTFRAASNIRAGLELRYDIFAIRGGFGYYGNPYKESVYKQGERYDISGGLGLRFKSSFIDFGVIHHRFENNEQPYVLSSAPIYSGLVSPTAQLRSNQTNAVVTFGWKF